MKCAPKSPQKMTVMIKLEDLPSNQHETDLLHLHLPLLLEEATDDRHLPVHGGPLLHPLVIGLLGEIQDDPRLLVTGHLSVLHEVAYPHKGIDFHVNALFLLEGDGLLPEEGEMVALEEGGVVEG